MCCLPTPHHELIPVPPLQARDCGGGTASPLRAFVSIRKRIPFLKTLYFQLPENCHNDVNSAPPQAVPLCGTHPAVWAGLGRDGQAACCPAPGLLP